MRLAVVGLVLATGCKGILGIETGVVSDASASDADADADTTPADVLADARTCFGTFQPICPVQPVADTVVVTSASLAACTDRQTVGGVAVCVVAARHVTVDQDVVVGTSQGPFVVLVATEDMTISGILDGWTGGVETATDCPPNDATGAGSGGPGGSFGSKGGSGGSGSGNIVTPSALAATTIPTFRRGCSGGNGGSAAPPGGTGGEGGSGIFLVAPTLHLTSTARINASGTGGGGGSNDRGGGGGGSGGLIVLDAETLQIDSGAIVVAAGGGGGGGGGAGTAQSGGRTTASLPITGGRGGAGGAAAAGDGGVGSITIAPGQDGQSGSNSRAGGGGGGGVGAIVVTAVAPMLAGTLVPAPQ